MKRILLLLLFVVSVMHLCGCDQPTGQLAAVQEKGGGQANVDTESNELSNGADSKETGDIVFGDQFPEVRDVQVTLVKNESWRFNVTLSSTYDSPQRYADAWRVLDDQDNELGVRVLGHDHANEQPFTRSDTVKVPSNTNVVFVEGRDQANGWSGQRFEVKLP